MALPTILTEGNEEEAARLVAAYYRRTADGLPAYTGSYFNSWSGGGDSGENRDAITADDLIAVSFLSVKIPGEAAIGFLDTHKDKISSLLMDIPGDRALSEVSPAAFRKILGKDSAAMELWHVLRGRDTGKWDVGRTKASKIMARKRPHLIPIYDSIVAPQMGLKNSDDQWITWHGAFMENHGLPQRLQQIRDKSGVEEPISDLRVMDIVLWMDGKQRPSSASTIKA